MKHYSIKDIEKITGIKAHTIRIWEKRYHLVSPERTLTNIRYYNDMDMKRLLNIAILNRYGYKISNLVEMSGEEINKRVIEVTLHETDFTSLIESFIVAMIEYDEVRFEKALNSAIIRLGFESAITNVIYPFLAKVGILWQTGVVIPGQEHFVTNLIRQKLILAIDSRQAIKKNHPRRFILFLPENEFHEIGLLFAHYLLKKYGHNTIYLGQNVPLSDVQQLVSLKKPDFILTSVTTSLSSGDLPEFLKQLSLILPDGQILAGGSQIAYSDNITPANIVTIKSVKHLTDFLESIH
ncbi:MAG TPA: cobalamin B12-binding domain-containing protein [Bacteroidales bacterium]|nr:cobalamin B12-binding domain-containing protein [Bacteroidales bacterium]HPT02434.1 cobalamin B12-binding domain-containing protein [Bacteroidales bacterium]